MSWLYSLIGVSIVSLISLIGVFALGLKEETIKRVSLFLVSLAVGGLLGDALLHLLPESWRRLGFTPSTSLLVITGLLLFFVLERFLRWQHCHEPGCEKHSQTFATINLIGDASHNFIDGAVIAASFLVSPALGLGTTLAVILHEIPHEIGNFGVLIHAGFSAKKALFFNFLTALFAVLGTLVALAVSSQTEAFSLALLPVTAGGFLYVAAADLVPELHRETKLGRSLWQFFFILLGLSLMLLLLVLER